ncbi:hypothetical protein E1258_30275 [Micromonospora sp. KC207]|uniref:hypothetical protein n=1 Tax=Micromonospora sp. KC207 TaxID=2530377 RepID=UPI001048BD65|nr:hypothetical protein [Micromonospora sp. KC207]TDC45507.1 hypothetical protein E1258_30275 [Micromonospora sp. KC207]
MRTLRILTAALVAACLVALPTAPAAAHNGKLKLTVAGDGAGGVTVRATHADGHRLDQPVRLVLTAEGEGDRKAGPLQLEPAAEGQGFYSSGPVLSPGRWQVTVTAPAPYQTSAKATVQARPAQSPPAPRPVAVQAGPDERDRSGVGWWTYAAGGLVAVALLAAVPLLLVRRRRPARPGEPAA